MKNTTAWPATLASTADQTSQEGHNTYLAPKITAVKFYVEKGYSSSPQITGTDSNYEATEEDGNQTYFGTRSF